ncbi:MAG: hypothetical protein V4683_18945 [Bacteroidota bacterium]
MNYKISFNQRAKLSLEMLKNRPLITLEEARKQAKWLKENSLNKNTAAKK